jgi:cold shock CspA family protein
VLDLSASKHCTLPPKFTTMSSGKRYSLVDIQAEQEQDARNVNNNNNNNRGGNSHAAGSSPRRHQQPQQRQRQQQQQQQQQTYDHLPLEQGVVCSVKDSFGFIYCADRPDELFFHFSELHNSINPNELVESRTNVSFRVGQKGNKPCALQVTRLEGPIEWEVMQGVYQGVVKRSTGRDRGTILDGTIQVTANCVGDKSANDANGALVKFTPSDWDQKGRLMKGDLVEFELVTVRRSKEQYARNIQLLLSEKERAREENEKLMLETATEVQGVVTSLKEDYGFLRSNKHREEIYFHYSSIDMEESEHVIKDGGEDVVLKEGQEMKFLVVDEGPQDKDKPKGHARRLSARRVSLQPKGSVKFHVAMACGVTGLVVQSPQPVDAGHSLEARGKVLLDEPIKGTDEDGIERLVTEVYLRTVDSPGGTYAFRGGSSVATLVQLGDTLLFDVVRDFVDGSCHASPTKHLVKNPNPFDLEEEGNDLSPIERRVRLIKLSFMARAEGIVSNIKDDFGFIHFAERPVDVHFKLYQLLPEEIQKDIRRNMGYADAVDGRSLRLEVGSEVQFDISVHGTIQGIGAAWNARRRQAKQVPERDNVKAQRILLLPPGTVQLTKTLATSVRGTITKVDSKQLYAGTIELESAVFQMPLDERHPLVAKMIDSFLNSRQTTPLVFHDLQCSKEDDIVVAMLEAYASGKLVWTHIPQPGEEIYPGKLCLRKLNEDEQRLLQKRMEQPRLGDGNDKSVDGGNGVSLDGISLEGMGLSDDEVGDDRARQRRNKKKKWSSQMVGSIRYDTASISEELKLQAPPALEDVVEFDVAQSRTTGMVMIVNLKIIKRKNPEAALAFTPIDKTPSAIGVVKEVVSARNFGFISVLDDRATSLEMLFFSLASVVGGDKDVGVGKKNKQLSQIRKGDEVSFDIVTDKNGKRVAQSVKILPKGTVPNQAEHNACMGYVVQEPSRASLTRTPIRHTTPASVKSEKVNSRWEKAEESAKTLLQTEPRNHLGYILLIEDSTHAFAQKPDNNVSLLGSEGAHPDGAPNHVPIESGSDQQVAAPATETVVKQNERSTCTYLPYNFAAYAIQGKGSSSAGDNGSNPRRGDLVSFTKSKNGRTPRDIRIVTRAAAQMLRGRLENIDLKASGTANFIASTEPPQTYEIDIKNVVSCEPTLFKEKESVEGILYEGNIYGINRTSDLYLESKISLGQKERPKLNLIVKKDRAGKIMAQTGMAKGPDGTDGFATGWTQRVSKYAVDGKDSILYPGSA